MRRLCLANGAIGPLQCIETHGDCSGCKQLKARRHALKTLRLRQHTSCGRVPYTSSPSISHRVASTDASTWAWYARPVQLQQDAVDVGQLSTLAIEFAQHTRRISGAILPPFPDPEVPHEHALYVVWFLRAIVTQFSSSQPHVPTPLCNGRSGRHDLCDTPAFPRLLQT